MPAVSIIIPIYGVEQYIENCARSLFEQTLEDIEYIFVDDCTTDKSIEILQKVLEEYPRRKPQTRIIRHETNQGLPQARKTGIENATGEFIANCDSDDWVDKEMYNTMYQKAKSEECDVVICDFHKTELNHSNIIQYLPDNNLNKSKILQRILSNTCCHYIWALLSNNKIYQNNLKSPAANLFEDLVFTTQILYFAKKIGYVQKPLYHYILRPTSMSFSQTLDQKQKNLIPMKKNIDVILSFLKENNVGEKYEKAIKFFHNLNYQTLIRTQEHKKQYSGYNYPEQTGGVLFSKEYNIVLKIRYLLVRLKLFRLHDWLDRQATANPWLKNKLA